MLFETKKNSSRLRFRLLIIGLVSLLWVGCSTEQMRNITGSTPLNAYSVIQGLVTGGSVFSGGTKSSLSSIVFEGGMHVYLESSENLNSNEDTADNLTLISQPQNFISSPESSSVFLETSTTMDINKQEPDEEGLFAGPDKIISLVTDSGIVLQTSIFNRYTASGKLHYRFAGEFPYQSLRLRIVEGEKVLEVAMGSLSEFDQVVDVPDLDLVNSTLATRMMEQTSEYKTLRHKDISSFMDSMNSIIDSRIDGKLNKNLLIENINRVGINNEGNFEIYSTNYDPFKYREPNQVKDWEKHLFHPSQEIVSEVEPYENMTKEDIPLDSSINKKLVNWIRLVSIVQPGLNKETQLFRNFDFTPHKPFPLHTTNVTLKIHFNEFLPIEFRDSLIEAGVLKVQNGDNHNNLLISDMDPVFQNTNVLELDIDLKLLAQGENKTVFIFLQHTFPNFRHNEIAQAFFKVSLEAY
tara:strand:- start:481 stop:1878 length:1398 start_codon:yes stop_codon:yes gene_type:complete